jgi:hypothetical protein
VGDKIMETTLNIHVDILSRITKKAGACGISRSKLITSLIKKVMEDIPDPGCLGTMVRYQESKDCNEWHVFHLQLRVDDYEYFLDLRKLLKMSVSLILAYAVNKYLGKLITFKADNYIYKHYAIIKEIINDTICWKFIWGFPPDLRKLLPKSQN